MQADPSAPRPLERERRDFVLRELQAGWRVLDLGCGDGRFTGAIAAAGAASVVGVDISAEAIGRASASYPSLEVREIAVGEGLPFADGEFDCVFCSEVIGQVVDVVGLLSEARRVLKPGGRLLLTTPYHGRLKSVLTALVGFERQFSVWQPQLRFFTKRSLGELVGGFGFEELLIRAVGGRVLVRDSLFLAATRASYAVSGRSAP